MATVDPTPGLLNLSRLAINKAINKGYLTKGKTNEAQRIAADQRMFLARELKDTEFRHAARNVLALTLYRTGKTDDAIKEWKDTVKEDKSNLNALQDLATCYDRIKSTAEADRYSSMLKEIQQSIEQGSPEEKRKVYARCQAEQAYALHNNLQTKSWDPSVLRQQQVDAFEDALSLGQDSVSQDERSYWHHYTGLAYTKLAHAQFRSHEKDLYQSSVKTATRHLIQSNTLIHSEGLDAASCTLKAQLWCALGNLFTPNKNESDHEESLMLIISELEDVSLEELSSVMIQNLKNPKLCYEEALKHEEKKYQAWIYARLGMYHTKQGNLQRAIDALNESISLVESLPDNDPAKGTCRLAYPHRAKTYMKMGKSAKVRKEKIKFFKLAIEVSIKAVELNPTPSDLISQGEAYCEWAKLYTNGEERDKLIQKALISFKEAGEISDNESQADLHFKSARCLKLKGDLKLATAAYKKAFTRSGPNSTFMRLVACEFLCCMFDFHASMEEPETLKRDAAYWLKSVLDGLKGKPALLEELRKKLSKQGYDDKLLSTLKFMVDKDVNAYCLTIDGWLSYALQITDASAKTKMEDLKRDFQAKRRNAYSPCLKTAQNEGCKYDFCLINDEEDSSVDEWVQHIVLWDLEETYSLKGCYHKRDSPLGKLETEAHTDNIISSAYVLVVVSSGFQGRSWCRRLANMACVHKDETRVFVLLKELTEVPQNLQDCLKFDFSDQEDLHTLAGNLNPENRGVFLNR